MEVNCSRFTPPEGGARLAFAARTKNLIITNHTAFVAQHLLHEEAYNIRGKKSDGKKRSVYITRRSRIKCTAYDIRILSDLAIVEAVAYDDITDWKNELEEKEVIVCTSGVLKRILEENILSIEQLNVMIIDSCHLIFKDDNLKYIMHLYKQITSNSKPRILGLTYPLFSPKKYPPVDTENDMNDSESDIAIDKDVQNDKDVRNDKDDCADKKDSKNVELEEASLENEDDSQKTKDGYNDMNDKPTETENDTIDNNTVTNDTKVTDIGVYENIDDFDMYEKLEWKLDMLEEALCCKADLAEDIDGIKRLSPIVTKPKELIVEFSSQKDASCLPESYVDLEMYMRRTIEELSQFLEDHRYDPMEIYGEDLYDELIKIPDPTIEPKLILKQFIYVLDQLGPYAADKAALSLLGKLEKLRIKVPYERHFLLLCICTTALVKIRCYADLIFASFENDWDKIQKFSTPKLLRFVEVLEKFKPQNDKESVNVNDIDTQIDKSDVQIDKSSNKKINDKLLSDIDNCNFIDLSNKIEDQINTLECNLKEIHLSTERNEKLDNIKPKDMIPKNDKESQNDSKSTNDIHNENKDNDVDPQRNIHGFPRRTGYRYRGRGRVPRANQNKILNQQNPDALCGIVFMKEPFMAKILFSVVVDLSRSHPALSYICAQYSAMEKAADPVKEPKEFEQQRKKQEDVLKKFRMYECNLLLATSILEEGIDLPRCNLVLRWDVPNCYRSHVLCKSRARCPRAACVLLSHDVGRNTETIVNNVAVYNEIDQLITRKCGCGIQDEPTQSEEEAADDFTSLVQPYTTKIINKNDKDKVNNDIDKNDKDNINNDDKINDIDNNVNQNDISNDDVKATKKENIGKRNDFNINDNYQSSGKLPSADVTSDNSPKDNLKNIINDNDKLNINNQNDSINGASVDLSNAVALINRYCAKLPSDTFTRLAPQWWLEKVQLPSREQPQTLLDAYICTLRLPLNCPVKYNIVGHPMPTPVLARRMVALQACRILHKFGELDNQLMPIGKENFQALELDIGQCKELSGEEGDASDIARPGTTKRRQYYYKKTAQAFTDCEPQIDSTDEEVMRPIDEATVLTKVDEHGRCNVAFLVWCRLWCALPERYNTRGRRLLAPQHAPRAVSLLMRAAHTHTTMQIPEFPVYTRSGEVRVSLKHMPNADTRLSPRRRILVLRFMKFVFADVLRVRRRGMKLETKGSTHNNYYIVPTIKSTNAEGETSVDIDWAFLEVIYEYTEYKRKNNIGKPSTWNEDEDSDIDININDNDNVKTDNVKNNNVLNKNDKTKNNKDIDKNEKDPDNTCDNAIVNEKSKKDVVINENQLKEDIQTNDVIPNNNGNDISKDNSINPELEPNYLKEENRSNNQIVKYTDITNAKSQMCSNKKVVKKMENPYLKPGETFIFDPEKYKEAVVTPWYRNQDQPQFFLVAEICWNLTPDSAFPSDTHPTFRSYYSNKYGVEITQPNQPLLDVDHTSARLNLLTPRYVNRKGVALPVSSERTRRAKRDRLDQKQILLPELCHTHPFPAPLWFATVALPAILYRVNALLIADEIREAVARECRLGIPKLTDPGFKWPPLDFGWSLSEVLNADSEKIKQNEENKAREELEEGIETAICNVEGSEKENDDEEIDNNDSAFEIGTWSNCMAAEIASSDLYSALPPEISLCSASGGANWCDTVDRRRNNYNSNGAFSMADSDSYMSSDFDTDDSDLNSRASDDDTESSGFGSNFTSAVGVRIEYKTPHEAEAIDVANEKKTPIVPAPQPSETQDYRDEMEKERFMRSGEVPVQYKEKFYKSIENQKKVIEENFIIKTTEPILDVLPPHHNSNQDKSLHKVEKPKEQLLNELFPYKVLHEKLLVDNEINIENIEKNKNLLLAELKKSLPETEVKKLNCFAMIDIDTDEAVNQQKEKNFYIQPDITSLNKGKPFGQSLNKIVKSVPNDGLSPESLNESRLKSDNECRKSETVNENRLKPENSNKDSINESSTSNENIAKINLNDRSVNKTGLNNENSCKSQQKDELKSQKDELKSQKDELKSESPHKDTPKKQPMNRGGFNIKTADEFKPYYEEDTGFSGEEFDFDYQPNLEGHPGPSPSLILQALTMSNANDGINLERLETIGDSFLKFAITARLYCAYPNVHEGKLSHMRSKQVSNLNLYRLGRNKNLGNLMIASKFEPHDNWLPPCHKAPQTTDLGQADGQTKVPPGCCIPYNLTTQHSIPDKSVADSVEALIGAYLLACGPRGALMFMCWLGLAVLPPQKPEKTSSERKERVTKRRIDEESIENLNDCSEDEDESTEKSMPTYGSLCAPPSPLLTYIADPHGELQTMLSGYDKLEETLQYRFKDRSLLLQAMTHASHQTNRLTDCYQRLEFLGDAVLDYLTTRRLFAHGTRGQGGGSGGRGAVLRHAPGALTDLRSALVNNTMFAALAARHRLHHHFRHMSPGLHEVLARYVKVQEENGHSISEEHYLIQEDEHEQAEDVEVPKALGDLFESVAGAIFVDGGMSLSAVWHSYERLMRDELEAFSAAAPKSPVRELLEQQPDTAKFSKPERLADGRRVRVKVEVFGRGTFKGIGRNYRIAKGTAARCALRHLNSSKR